MNSISMWGRSTEIVTNKIRRSLEKHFDVVTVNMVKDITGGLLVIDAVLGEEALALCKEIKSSVEAKDFSVILLVDGDPEKIVSGFAVGASEVINYNSSSREIAARVDACWRRHRQNQQTRLIFCDGRIELDPIRNIISCHTAAHAPVRSVEVTRHEFHLFFELISVEPKIVPRKNLLSAVWGEKVNVLARTVDKHVSSLREKTREIGKIGSVRGGGYFFHAHGFERSKI